jgi:hypothetical protein
MNSAPGLGLVLLENTQDDYEGLQQENLFIYEFGPRPRSGAFGNNSR